MKKSLSRIVIVFALACLYSMIGIISMPLPAHAEETTVEVEGKLYTFGEDDHYDYAESGSAEADPSVTANGKFTITGDLVKDGEKEGAASFAVSGDSVAFTYGYDDALLTAGDEDWHLVDDKSNTAAGVTLSGDILKGALILQTSKDGQEWLNEVKNCNIFADQPTQDKPFYAANVVQLANGYHYRVIIAYEIGRKTGESQFLFLNSDNLEYQKIAEVYEFYLHSAKSASNGNIQTKTLGSVVNTGVDNGYSGADELKIKDPHYGWQIGSFYVSGYTRDTTDDETPVFLKNPGDEVTLWFKLRQDIDALNGDENLRINEDTNGYDQHFQTPRMDMGRGTLIIRYTDEKGEKHEPEIYTNYLLANAALTADTVVRLFEEGDYEVALDYEIKKMPLTVAGLEVFPEFNNYQIFFEFKVRNGNCMVYPFDIETGMELSDESVTTNGFRLDLARSRYLKIDVAKSVVTQGANGYAEDVRFNRPAKDGEEYVDEGIYTFSVKNLYTNESTTKKIYVGDTACIRALSLNKMTIAELNDLLDQGAEIGDDGKLKLPEPPEPVTSESVTSKPAATESVTTPEEIEGTETPPEESAQGTTNPSGENPSHTQFENNSGLGSLVLPGILLAILIVVVVGTVFIVRKKKKNDGGDRQ